MSVRGSIRALIAIRNGPMGWTIVGEVINEASEGPPLVAAFNETMYQLSGSISEPVEMNPKTFSISPLHLDRLDPISGLIRQQ